MAIGIIDQQWVAKLIELLLHFWERQSCFDWDHNLVGFIAINGLTHKVARNGVARELQNVEIYIAEVVEPSREGRTFLERRCEGKSKDK